VKNTDINLTGSKHDIEKQTQKKESEKFNNITQKKKVENQNQEHNVVREGKGPQNSFK
jgi:hypothetical protein